MAISPNVGVLKFYVEECALYPCEECGVRGQDILNLNIHVKECHNSTTQSINQSDSTLEEFEIENSRNTIIHDQGSIEIKGLDTV